MSPIPAWLRPHAEGVTIGVAAQPGAKRSELVGEHAGLLKIKVQAPPVEGAANEAIGEFLAKLCGVKPRAVGLSSGATSRQKVFLVKGVSVEGVLAAVMAALTQNGSPRPP